MKRLPTDIGLLLLALGAPPLFAAPPQVTREPSRYVVQASPGATIAYVYRVITTDDSYFGAAQVSDSDGDGRIAIELGAMTGSEREHAMAVADVATGEHAFGGAVFGDWTGREGLYPDPSGAYSLFSMRVGESMALWVRPGRGAWSPGARPVPDDDGTNQNQYLYSTLPSFAPLGSSPAASSGAERGDLLLLVTRGTILLGLGGVVDPLLDAPRAPGQLAFANYNATLTEGAPYVMTVVRRLGSEGTVSVRCCAAANGNTAVAGQDYVPLDQTITFGPGEMIRTVTVQTIDDAAWSGERRLYLELTGVSPNSSLGVEKTNFVRLLENDPEPRPGFGAFPLSVDERDVPYTIQVPVTLTGARAVPVNVRFNADVQNGPGAGTQDLLFQPNETVRHATVTIPADDVVRPNARIRLRVQVTGTSREFIDYIDVLDDDSLPLEIRDAAAVEGGTAVVHVSFTPVNGRPVRFNWTTADGTARSGVDYVATSGKETAEIVIPIVADAQVEDSETFYVDITAVTDAQPVRTRAVITILDDDHLPRARFENLEAAEGSGTAATVNARLVIPEALPFATTYGIDIVGGTATFGADFRVTINSVTVAAGATSADIPITIVADRDEEADETIVFGITGTGVTGTFTILDDDAADGDPFAFLHDETVSEGTGAGARVRMRVTLSAFATAPVTVRYRTVAGTAAAGLDFTETEGTVTFRAGEFQQEIALDVAGDATDEIDETFRVTLFGATGVRISRGEATVTILDDDGPAPPPARKRSVRH